MKKTILLLFFIGLFINCLSQTQKGDMALAVSAAPYTEQNSDNVGLITNVSFEYFLSSKVSLQSNFIIANNSVLYEDDDRSVTAYGFLPSIQYYFLNKEKFQILGQFGYGFGFDDETRSFGVIENSALRIFSIGFGGNYTISDKLQIKLFVPYFDAKNITLNETSANGITAFLGFNFML